MSSGTKLTIGIGAVEADAAVAPWPSWNTNVTTP